MASASLKTQLRQLMESMVEEGLLNDSFLGMHVLQTPARSTIIDHALTQAVEESGELMEKLKYSFNETDLNFAKIDELAVELCRCAGRIGSHRLRGATQILRHLVYQNNKERSLAKFSEVCEHYRSLKYKFETILQLIDQILEAEDED